MQAQPSGSGAGTPRSRVKGCLLVAGIAALAVTVVVASVAAVLLWKARTWRERYSDAELRAVRIAEANAATAGRLNRTYAEFQRAAAEGRSERFVFTDQQLNQIVSTVPAVRDARGRAHFSIVDDHLKVEAGIPLDQIPGCSGRYFNGEFTLDIRLADGVLNLRVLDAAVRGQPLPAPIMEHLRQLNLAEQAMQNPEFRQQMSGLKALRIEGGRLIVETGR
jgi:hypothetical protein